MSVNKWEGCRQAAVLLVGVFLEREVCGLSFCEELKIFPDATFGCEMVRVCAIMGRGRAGTRVRGCFFFFFLWGDILREPWHLVLMLRAWWFSVVEHSRSDPALEFLMDGRLVRLNGQRVSRFGEGR